MALRVPTTAKKLPKQVRARNRSALAGARIGINRAAARGRTILVRKTPVDQGQLKASWKLKLHKPSGGARVGTGMVAENINDAPHAGIVEGGARPHRVNQEGWMAIYEWVRRHFGFTTSPGGRMQRAPSRNEAGDLDPVYSEITWGIVHKLRREGQTATWFVRDAIPEIQKLAFELIVAEIKKRANRKLKEDR